MSLDRRGFLKRGAVASLAFWSGTPAKAQSQKLRLAVIGCGGRGAGDIDGVKSEQFVAFADADFSRAAKSFKTYPEVPTYDDFRVMLERHDKEIDAVVIATPDHTHAAATMMALKMGKHVYTEKPLTRTVHEARTIREYAAAHPELKTQMGNQGTASNGLREAVEAIRSGAIGQIREAHIWSNRPVWPQGLDRPTDVMAVPQGLNWDLWLGPSPMRPYHKAYLPFSWRGWWDFGTGALGDMACHTANMPFMALDLGYPTSIEAVELVEAKPECGPKQSILRYQFPRRYRDGHQPSAPRRHRLGHHQRWQRDTVDDSAALEPLTWTWYDGGQRPNWDEVGWSDVGWAMEDIPKSGCLLIGDQGKLFSPGDYGSGWKLYPEADFEGWAKPAPTLPRSPGHHKEWIAACKGEGETMSNFNYAGFLTEVVVLGALAVRLNTRLEWDGPAMKVTNLPAAAALVQPEYRPGWTL